MKQLFIDIHSQQHHFNLKVNSHFNLSGILGVLGHSGSGKTTLLKTITGLTTNAIGKIRFDGQTLMDSRTNLFVPCEKRGVALVFQEGRLFPHLNVLENLTFAQKRCHAPTITLDEIITLTNIESLLDKGVDEISGGEKQRVALARAILSEPKLLLLDEPLSALDQVSKAALINLLKKIHRQLSLPMLYVSHNLDEIQQLADELLVLNQGTITHYGNVHQVIHQLNHSNLIKQQTSLSLPVLSVDKQHGLMSLQVDEQQTIQVIEEQFDHSVKQVRCFIFANEISLTTQEPTNSSIVNQLRAKITHIDTLQYQALVTLSCGQHQFFANISTLSLTKLALEIHQGVYMQFKASAVRTIKRGI